MFPLGGEQDCLLSPSEPVARPCGCTEDRPYHLDIHVGLPCKQNLRVVGIGHLSTCITFDEVEPGLISHITMSLQVCRWTGILWVVEPATPCTILTTCVRVVVFLHTQNQSKKSIIAKIPRRDSCGDVSVREVW